MKRIRSPSALALHRSLRPEHLYAARLKIQGRGRHRNRSHAIKRKDAGKIGLMERGQVCAWLISGVILEKT
ncbi:MAG: hypothetical protein ACE5JP_16990 [Candidatus Bipolaricaulia bacterium]